MSDDQQSNDAQHRCDILVIGSGVSGYCAAIQAGRLGWRTILIDKDEVLGGNSGPNLGVGITGADRYNYYGTETGIVHETQEEAAWVQAFTQIFPGQMPYNISRRYEAVIQQALRDAGVVVLKRHYARQPIVDDNGAIRAVVVEDLAAFRTVRIDVEHIVIEASGDGEIGVMAGADYDAGSEAQSEFDERSAPPHRTQRVQGTSLVAIAQKTGHEVVFIPPAGTPDFFPRVWHGRMQSFIHHHDRWFTDMDGSESPEGIKFLYVTEAGGDRDTVKDDGEIYEILLQQLWAEWDHIKNGPHREDARNWDLLWVSPKAGKRESRRLLGDVIITQTDVESGRRFPDDIAYGGHDLDDHRPLGDGGNIFGHSIPPMYGIPYRSCYSRNVPNLLLAGRLISATHLAHSSTRLMRTGGAIGQAIGYAAALCCRYNCPPRTIYTDHLDEFRGGLLEADGTILTLPVPPNGDLAREADVSASSEMRFADQVPGILVPLIATAGNLLWDWSPICEGVEVFVRNQSQHAEETHLTVFRSRCEPKWKGTDEFHRHGRNDLRDSAFSELLCIPVSIPAGIHGWFRIQFSEPLVIGEKDEASDDDRLLITLDENQAIEWALSAPNSVLEEIVQLVEHSHFIPEWREVGRAATMRMHPPPKLGEATNVVDGHHRRYSRGPLHMWVSDSDRELAQDLLLTWSQPVEFDEVSLVFDNLTRHRHDNPWECGQRVLPILVRDYELSYWDGNSWQTLIEVRDNYNRFMRHRFTPTPIRTDRLRLRVIATHGDTGGARVYQIRVKRCTS